MSSRYPIFDRSRLRLKGLDDRSHDMTVAEIIPLDAATPHLDSPELDAVAAAIAEARRDSRPVVMLFGAHVIKQGLSRYLIDLIDRGMLTAIAGNGACAIHDYELARVGASTESVARYIRDGQFGLWAESGGLNDIVAAGAAEGLGFGEALGQAIATGRPAPGESWSNPDISVFAAAYRRSVPATVHIGIGYDIVHEHPNFDPAASAEASYRDFLVLAQHLMDLEGGVVLCVGSAVMGPEVYLKALAMARNVAHQHGRKIARFTAAVFDLLDLPGDLMAEAPKHTPQYYYRPYKTLLVRTVADGGASHYIRGDHRVTIPALRQRLLKHLA